VTRFKTPFAEIDILALRPDGGVLVCEVKSSLWPDDRALGLGERQRRRLARAASWVAEELDRDVEIVLLGPSTRGGDFLEIPIF
jgi:Holliday junction resolvase-like predicted endonuclease